MSRRLLNTHALVHDENLPRLEISVSVTVASLVCDPPQRWTIKGCDRELITCHYLYVFGEASGRVAAKAIVRRPRLGRWRVSGFFPLDALRARNNCPRGRCTSSSWIPTAILFLHWIKVLKLEWIITHETSYWSFPSFIEQESSIFLWVAERSYNDFIHLDVKDLSRINAKSEEKDEGHEGYLWTA